MPNNTAITDRRLAENAMLRSLVDALKMFIASRDAIWALRYFDRLLRTKKYHNAYQDYDEASAKVNALIRAMAIKNSDSSEPVISSEEFDALMRLAGDDSHYERHKYGNGKRRKPEPVSKTIGPAFKPIVPPASSIAPMTPSGANAILDQATVASLSGNETNA